MKLSAAPLRRIVCVCWHTACIFKLFRNFGDDFETTFNIQFKHCLRSHPSPHARPCAVLHLKENRFQMHLFLGLRPLSLISSWRFDEIVAIKLLRTTRNAIAATSMNAKVIHAAMPSRANWKVRPNVPTVYAVIIARFVPIEDLVKIAQINFVFSFFIVSAPSTRRYLSRRT